MHSKRDILLVDREMLNSGQNLIHYFAPYFNHTFPNQNRPHHQLQHHHRHQLHRHRQQQKQQHHRHRHQQKMVSFMLDYL